jgi:cullin 4
LKEAVIAIQTSKPIVYSLEELYQAVENMCSHKMDSQLYVNLTGLAEGHVKANIRPFLAERIDKLVIISIVLIKIQQFKIIVSSSSSSFISKK